MKLQISELEKWLIFKIKQKNIANKLNIIGIESVLQKPIIDITVPGNRHDCYCVIGIAREISIINKNKIKLPIIKPKPLYYHKIIAKNESKKCLKYIYKPIYNINNSITSPGWIIKQIELFGVKSTSLVIDIARYVTITTGQLINILDLNHVNNNIVIKDKHESRHIQLDNHETINIDNSIGTYSNSKFLALTGVINSKKAGINKNTKNIIIECAIIDPLIVNCISVKSNTLSNCYLDCLKSSDYTIQEYVIEYTTDLILNICNGQQGKTKIAIQKHKYIKRHKILFLKKQYIDKVLGKTINDDFLISILNLLEIKIINNTNVIKMIIPSFRKDLNLEIDLIEEILRIYGINKIIPISPSCKLGTTFNKFIFSHKSLIMNLKYSLVNHGYNEIITYSFVNSKLETLLFLNISDLYLIDPISSDINILRSSLIPGLLNTIKFNKLRQKYRLRFFETGYVFDYNKKKTKISQYLLLSGAITGKIFNTLWNTSERNVNFFDIKNDIEAICGTINNSKLLFIQRFDGFCKYNYMLSNKTKAQIMVNDKMSGIMGLINPQIINKLCLYSKIYMFEIRVKNLMIKKEIKFKNISKFSYIYRDCNIYLKKTINASTIISTINYICPIIRKISIINIYEKKDFKNMCFRIFYQHMYRTLIDQEIFYILNTIFNNIKKKNKNIL